MFNPVFSKLLGMVFLTQIMPNPEFEIKNLDTKDNSVHDLAKFVCGKPIYRDSRSSFTICYSTYNEVLNCSSGTEQSQNYCVACSCIRPIRGTQWYNDTKKWPQCVLNGLLCKYIPQTIY